MHLERISKGVNKGIWGRYIYGHWGEMVSYYPTRLDEMFSPAVTGLKEPFSFYYKRNVYISPSGLYDNDALTFCVVKLGIDRILFSTDWPYVPLAETAPLIANAPLSESGKEKMAHLNAVNLLKI